MISIYLKSFNKATINSLEKSLELCDLPEIYYLQKDICGLTNLIIHYKGKNRDLFFLALTNIISNYIIDSYEHKFIEDELNFDYFYFSQSERNDILIKTKEYLSLPIHKEEKVFLIKKAIDDYFAENKKCNLDGFITFRLYKYKDLISKATQEITCEYVVNKEYLEYINVLREYISLEVPQSDMVHLIYNTNIKILLDNSHNIITNASNSKVYLSDITFSSNDFLLHSLLTLLPKKIVIHIDDENDEFINFLSSIFLKRVSFCRNCDICNSYLQTQKMD